MSLIQQALKRKQEEQQGKGAPVPPPLPSSPLVATPNMSATHRALSQASRTSQGDEPPRAAAADDAGQPRKKLSLAQAHDVAPSPQAAAFARQQVQDTPAPPAPSAMPARQPAPPVSPGSAPKAAGDDAVGRIIKLAFLFLILLLIGGATFFIMWRIRSVRESTVSGVASSPAVAGTQAAEKPAKGAQHESPVEAGKGGGVSSFVPLPNIPAIHAKVEKLKEGVEEFRKESAAAEQGVTTPAPAAQNIRPPVAAPAAPQPVAAPVVAQPVQGPAVGHVPAVAWPSVRISGVMARSSNGQQAAIINDALVNLGESVDGMTLSEVHDTGVTMEFKGEKRNFTVGGRAR